jgi:hypothetical protein
VGVGGGGLGGALAQCLGSHDDAGGVEGQAQDVGVVDGWGLALSVEGVEVAGGAYGEVLQLAFAEQDAGAAVYRVDGVVEGAAGGLEGRQAAQPVGVFLGCRRPGRGRPDG